MQVDVDGVRLNVVEVGAGDQTVVLSHSYLVDHRQFAAQIDALSDRYRVIAYDHRDHGASGQATAAYDLDRLVDDARAVIEGTHAAPCHFVGLSTGGFIGLRLALRHPELLRSLTVMDTSAEPETLGKRLKYRAMLLAFRFAGFRLVQRRTMQAMFSAAFLDDPARQDEVATWRRRIAASDPRALQRFGRAIFDRDDVLGALSAVRIPTLVVVGAHDAALPPEHARAVAQAVPGAELAVIPRAGHLCTVERPDAVNAVLLTFLERVAAQR